MGTQQIIGNLQIVTGSVGRNELNTITPDQAVVTKIIAGSGVTLSSSGVDAGTGDVTISVSGTGGGASSSFDNFWTSGSAGQYSIRAKNNTNINALGAYSFAVGGNNTLASGSHSVAEGDGVQALGFASHAEGSGSLAMKIGDHAEGISTVANGPSSHAEGNGVVVHGQASHGEGERNIVSGTNSFVGGFKNSNFSDFSAIIGGTGTVLPVSAIGSVALGRGLAGYSMPYPDTVFTPNLNVRFVQSGTPITNLGIDANGNIVSGTSSAASSLLIQDEGIPKGSALTLNVVGNNVDISVSGTVARLFVTGTPSTPIPEFSIPVYDDGVFIASGTKLSFDSNLTVVATGTSVFINSAVGSATGTVGWLPYAFPIAFDMSATYAASNALAANGGSVAIPIILSAPMALESISVSNLNTSLARTWGWDIYKQNTQTENASENTLVRVAQCSANDSFTPAAASIRTLTALGEPVYLAPGLYWLVIQNRHASNNFAMAVTSALDAIIGTVTQTKTTTNPNGATLDFVAATWVKRSSEVYGVRLNGEVFGQNTAF